MIRFPSRSDHPSCPAGWRITQALSQPETSADVVRHVRDCPACAQLAAELRGVMSAAAEMPPVAPLSQAARERISQALSIASDEATPPSATLPSAALPSDERRRMRFAWAFAVGLAGLAVALAGWFHAARQPAIPQVSQRTAEPASLARIRAFGEARFHRFSEPPDEMVRLESGRVAFEVSHLTREQRFRVVTRDGEVEVRGTRFETEARDGVLWAVVVTEGKVDVRVGDAVLRLRAGDEWRRQPPSLAVEEPATAAPVATREPPRVHEPSGGSHAHVAGAAVQSERVKPASQASQASKESFDLAWSHLRRREWDGAMRGFADVAVQAHGQALEEDALYWQAVATARAGRAREAGQLFEALLQRFPAGVRTGAATLALAWLRFDAGERDNARLLFERAAQDSSAKVREGADEGLHRLPAR